MTVRIRGYRSLTPTGRSDKSSVPLRSRDLKKEPTSLTSARCGHGDTKMSLQFRHEVWDLHVDIARNQGSETWTGIRTDESVSSRGPKLLCVRASFVLVSCEPC